MAAALDTLRFSQRLQQTGVSREQADAHAELARDMVLAELATKDDLLATKTELLTIKGDLGATKTELKSEILSTKNELKAEALATKNELKAEMLATKNDLLAGIREVELRVTIKSGAMIAAGVGVILAAQRFF